METDTALVGAYSVVVLNTVAHVGLDLALVVHPCNTELINSVGNAKTFYQVSLVKLGVLVIFFLDCCKYLFNGLMILGFVGKASLQIF